MSNLSTQEDRASLHDHAYWVFPALRRAVQRCTRKGVHFGSSDDRQQKTEGQELGTTCFSNTTESHIELTYAPLGPSIGQCGFQITNGWSNSHELSLKELRRTPNITANYWQATPTCGC